MFKKKNFNDKMKKSLLSTNIMNEQSICHNNDSSFSFLNNKRKIDKEEIIINENEDNTGLTHINNSALVSNDEENTSKVNIIKNNIEINKLINEGKIEANVYRGKNNYLTYLTKSETDLSKHKISGTLGPMKVDNTIRAISQIDYSRGICKDYKLTGVCGYGDGCIFLHDRTEYKSSYEIDQEIKKKEAKRLFLLKKEISLDDQESKLKNTSDSLKQKEEYDLICPICNKTYKNSVITICQHVFCESCALQHYETSKICYICKKELKGIFNNASLIEAKIKAKEYKNK